MPPPALKLVQMTRLPINKLEIKLVVIWLYDGWLLQLDSHPHKLVLNNNLGFDFL